MEQVAQFLAGERDYPKIRGGTGPLVYPAAHVYIYTGLYHLTDQGRDIFLAQILFAILYLATLAVVIACYRQAKARFCPHPPSDIQQDKKKANPPISILTRHLPTSSPS